MNSLYPIIEEFIEEKGIAKETIIQGLLESLEAFYENKYSNIKTIVKYDKKKEEILIGRNVTAVEKIENDETEILLKKARQFDPKISIGESLFLPFAEKLTRVEIVKIKQLLMSKIKALEINIISKEFSDKINTIFSGLVYKIDSRGVSVLIQGHNAYLPKTYQIPGEKILINTNIKVLIKEINHEAKNFDEIVIVDRVSPLFIEKLLELEIPEIFDKLITIEKVVRISGYKSKVLLHSKDINLNLVGTCIGVSGSRIKPILSEIVPERIDFIKSTKDLEQLITESLKPGRINFVEIKDKKAYIHVNNDEKAIIIGRFGKNITLASQLTGLEIEIIDKE